MNTNWSYIPFSQIVEWQEKSKIKSGDGKAVGKYKMFICSDTAVKKYDESLVDKEALIFGTGGKASLHYCNEKFAYSTDCVVACKKDNQDCNNLKFYYYYLRQNRMQLLQKDFTGSGLQHTSKKKIGALSVPLPTVEEQNKIVAKIEEFFSELDKAVDTLQNIKKQLAVYRQAVLKSVFDKKHAYTTFGTISNSRLGKMLDKSKNIGIPRKYLRNINVRWFCFKLDDLLTMRIENNEVEKYSLNKNDLVICEGGEPGRCAVWEKNESIFYQKALHRVRFTDGSNPYFYMYYLWFAYQTGVLKSYFTGTGIKHLTGQSLSRLPVPHVDRIQQNCIVQEIESRLSVCDNIEKTIDTALLQSEALRQTILKQAFEGELIK